MMSFLTSSLDQELPDDMKGAVIAIGNFDGVHRGHQVVLEHALRQARETNKKCFVLSFEPHPRTLFRPQSPVFRLTSEAMKARVLDAFGLDGMLILPFTRDLAATSADDFVDAYLCKNADAAHVISGFNFHFGKDRAGTPEFLKQAGESRSFGVTIVEALEDDDVALSSSLVRRLLGSGDVEAAAKILGYRWMVSGTVKKGAQLGRTLNYPTANLSLPESCHLAHGIYAVRLRRKDGSLHNGVASFGRRPTFDNGAPLLETFVFDFDADLYGEEVEVSLFAHLRDEEKFDAVEDLVVQMDKDSDAARRILLNAEPLSPLDENLVFQGLC